MKYIILIFSLLFAPATFAADIAGENQLITKALGIRTAEATLNGFSGRPDRTTIGSSGKVDCWLRINLDTDRAYIQLWSKEPSRYSSESHLEYVHGADEPDVFSAPRILENSDESLKLETDVSRPKRVFFPDGAEQTLALTIRRDQNNQLLLVEISERLREEKPSASSRLACRFPIAP